MFVDVRIFWLYTMIWEGIAEHVILLDAALYILTIMLGWICK